MCSPRPSVDGAFPRPVPSGGPRASRALTQMCASGIEDPGLLRLGVQTQAGTAFLCGGDMKNPSGALGLGRGPEFGPGAFRLEGSSASGARVDARRGSAGGRCAQSIDRSCRHSPLDFFSVTRELPRARDAASTLVDSGCQARTSIFFSSAARSASGMVDGPRSPITTCVVSQTPTHLSPMKRAAPMSNEVLPKRVTPRPTS